MSELTVWEVLARVAAVFGLYAIYLLLAPKRNKKRNNFSYKKMRDTCVENSGVFTACASTTCALAQTLVKRQAKGSASLIMGNFMTAEKADQRAAQVKDHIFSVD